MNEGRKRCAGPTCQSSCFSSIIQVAGPSPSARADVDSLVNSLLGPPSKWEGLDSGDLTPSSSIPGTPSYGHIGLPGPSGFSASGRLSRQSDLDFVERRSTTPLIRSTSSATDHIVERYAYMYFVLRLKLSSRGRAITPRSIPELIDIEEELFELPQKVMVSFLCYTGAI